VVQQTITEFDSRFDDKINVENHELADERVKQFDAMALIQMAMIELI
jgi:hypothetical protein